MACQHIRLAGAGQSSSDLIGGRLRFEHWFDCQPERELAVSLDGADGIVSWVRLLRRDLEIAWENGNYNPDFVAVAADGLHWLIEVKSDRDAGSEDVQAKREAAQKWASHASAAPKLNGVRWRYLLVREADLSDAKGSWPTLEGLGPT